MSNVEMIKSAITNARTGSGTSERFIKMVIASDFGSLPKEAVEAAKTFLADSCAVGVAGAGHNSADQLLSASASSGPCNILGRPGVQRSAYDAALINGFQIHCLEWDGLHEPSVVIALCATTAALLSECGQRAADNPVSGEALIHAFAIGVESAVFFGAGATTGPRFFRPAIAGLMGASMALGRLRNFSHSQMLDLLGLAYSQASGTMQAHWEGSEALGLQVGFAARAALTAADLVAAGLSGPHDVIDGKFGYFALFETASTLDHVFDRWAKPWKVTELAHKPFPAGRATQSALTVLLEAKKAGGFGMADVASLTIHVPPLIMLLVGRPYHSVMLPGYARLCMEYIAPEMVEYGRIDPRRCTPDYFARAEAAEFASKIHVVLDDNPDENALSPQRVTLELLDGRRYDLKIDAPLGSPDNPLDLTAQIEKARFCFEVGGFSGNAEQWFKAIAGLETAKDARSILQYVMKGQNA